MEQKKVIKKYNIFLIPYQCIFNLGKKTQKLIQIPALSQSIPDSVQYLLIGGGTASFSAFRAIKSADPTARVSH